MSGRRADPEGPSGDRNGEPSEDPWPCLLVVLAAVAIVAIVAIALVGAALSDGPWDCYAPCI